jgi:hypothetical protein
VSFLATLQERGRLVDFAKPVRTQQKLPQDMDGRGSMAWTVTRHST